MAELVKFNVPALIVRASPEASPIWRFPRMPALLIKVDEAVTVRKSVDASPMKLSPKTPNRVSVVEAPTERLDVIWASPESWRLPEVVVATPTPSPPVKYPLPWMERAARPEGEEVPMPTRPVDVRVRRDIEEVAYASDEVAM